MFRPSVSLLLLALTLAAPQLTPTLLDSSDARFDDAESRHRGALQTSAVADSGVVLIRVVSVTGDSLYGNGAVIALGTVATERALLNNARSIVILSAAHPDGLAASVLRVDSTTNVALLSAPGLNATPVRVSSRSLTARERVRVVTQSVGETQLASVNAIVLGIEPFVGVELAQLSTSLDTGMLGAPVLNAAGELMALAFTTETDGVPETYAIPSRYVAELLNPRIATRAEAAVMPRPTARPASSPAASTPTTGRSTTTPTATRARSAAAMLQTTGLLNARLIDALVNGQFADISMDRESPLFRTLLQEYLDACAERCAASLPANRVEMTRQRCTEETTEYNGYGIAGASYCSRYVTEGRGLYADPLLYSAMTALDRQAAANVMKDVLKIMTQPNMLGATFALIGDGQTLAKDMDLLVQMNACASPAIRQFEDNLRQFAIGKQPRWVNGSENTGLGSGAQRAGAGPFVDSDYVKLMDDLIFAQSRSWAMNRYRPNSVTAVNVESRDPSGHPSRLVAQYTFEGLNGYTKGSVRVEFADGLPECLYFYDAPGTCRTPNQQLLARYANGEYRKLW